MGKYESRKEEQEQEENRKCWGFVGKLGLSQIR